jgi:cell wall-associated NlpC family hydrolase
VTGADVVAKATSQLGVVEKGGRDGKSGNIVPYWDWWKACTGENDQGQSWCACFVSWCFSQVMASSLIAAKNKYGFIYCPDGVNYFKKKNQLVAAKSAQAGDIIFFDWTGAGSADHVGIVVENHAAQGYLLTIEGNTSAEGIVGASQSNGGGVYKRKRFIDKTIFAVARPSYPTLTATK